MYLNLERRSSLSLCPISSDSMHEHAGLSVQFFQCIINLKTLKESKRRVHPCATICKVPSPEFIFFPSACLSASKSWKAHTIASLSFSCTYLIPAKPGNAHSTGWSLIILLIPGAPIINILPKSKSCHSTLLRQLWQLPGDSVLGVHRSSRLHHPTPRSGQTSYVLFPMAIPFTWPYLQVLEHPCICYAALELPPLKSLFRFLLWGTISHSSDRKFT